MAKKIIGIILVAAGILTGVLGTVAGGNAAGSKDIIENAIYVEDGIVSAENEGKTVIVHGTLEADLPYADEETGVLLDSIVTYRQVEKLRTNYDSEEERDYWTWDQVMDENKYGGSKKVVAPGVVLGDFAVAEELLLAIEVTEKRTEYDKKELNQKGWQVFDDNGKVFLYQYDHMPCDDEIISEIYYKDYVDTLRVTYSVIPESNTLEYTMIGVQQNGVLVKAEGLDLLAVYSGKLSAQDLLAYAESSARTATITSICIAAVLLGAGIVLFVLGSKKRS